MQTDLPYIVILSQIAIESPILKKTPLVASRILVYFQNCHFGL